MALGKGAKIGILVAVVLVVIIGSFAVYYCCKHKKSGGHGKGHGEDEGWSWFGTSEEGGEKEGEKPEPKGEHGEHGHGPAKEPESKKPAEIPLD